MGTPERKFEIHWCETCHAFYVECPRCGNNCCNGTYGEEGKCPVCPLAYAVQSAVGPAVEPINRLLFLGEDPEDDQETGSRAIP